MPVLLMYLFRLIEFSFDLFILDSGCLFLVSGFLMLVSGFLMLVSGCLILDFDFLFSLLKLCSQLRLVNFVLL